MSRFKPDIVADSVLKIDPETFLHRGILWLAIDVDNTLALPNSPILTDEISAWLQRVKQLGLPVILVSNNLAERVEPFAKLCGLPFISRAMKPLGMGLFRAAKKIGLPLKKGALIGDQIFTDVYAAKKRGMLAVLVHPMMEEESRFFSIKRRLERFVRARQDKRGA